MPSVATTNYGFEKQARAENSNTWGGKLNTGAIDLIDDALARISVIAHDDSPGGITLSNDDFVRNQSRARIIRISGGVTQDNRIVIVPDKQRVFHFDNATNRPLHVQAGASGTPIAVPNGMHIEVYTDGNGNIEQVDNYFMSLKVDNLTFDNVLPKSNLPADIVYSLTPTTDESLSSAFNNVTGIRPTRLPNRRQIDGAVTQMLSVMRFPLADLYGAPDKHITVSLFNDVIHDIKFYLVNVSSNNTGTVRDASSFFYRDANGYLRQFNWYLQGNLLVVAAVGSGGLFYGFDRTFGGVDSANLRAADWEVVVHITGGLY